MASAFIYFTIWYVAMCTQGNTSLIVPQQVDAMHVKAQDVDVGNGVMREYDAMADYVQDDIHNGRDVTNDSKSMKSLLSLPTELLVKVLSYLPTRDKIMVQYVSRRFQDVSEIPLLWKEFNWADYEPRHQCSVSNILKRCGKHVRRISFPMHVTPRKVLEMVCNCKEVTHLSLPKDTKDLRCLKLIVQMLTHLQQLEVFADVIYIRSRPTMFFIEDLLKISGSSVSKLKLKTHGSKLEQILAGIQRWANQGYPLPPVIYITVYSAMQTASTSQLFKFWLTSGSNSKLPSFEIMLYDESIPMKLLPPVLLRRYKFGPCATISLIRLSRYGIVDLKCDIFHLNEYDHYGTVRYALTSEFYHSLVGEKHIDYSISCLHSVSYIDISSLNVHSNHLKQLSVVCPDLQFLNIRDNIDCLKDLEGLRAIVHTCQNLKVLDIAGISVSMVESSLSLWELLSTLKKLAYLSIELCMLYDRDNAKKKKLITIFERCLCLHSLEIHCRQKWKRCMECDINGDFLFSHFPSLQYCKLCDFQYTGIPYVVTNCPQLNHLQDFNTCMEGPLLPHFSINCHLRLLCINSLYLDLTDESLQELSAHGELEQAYLRINSITIRGITTIIKNSPDLIELTISSRKPVYNELNQKYDRKYTDRVREMFPYHKLFVAGKATLLNYSI